MRSDLKGLDCLKACEAAARKKKKLGPEYTGWFFETLPHDSRSGFERVIVRLGKKVKRANGRSAWIDRTGEILLTAEEVEAAVAVAKQE